MTVERKIYFLMAVATPVAVVAVIWAWTVDSLFVSVYYSILLAIWIVYVLAAIRKISKRREVDETNHTADRTPRRRNMILERTVWLFILVVSTTSLVWRLYDSASFYLILASIWAMIVSMGHLLYVGVLTDK